jgi:bla regulator protein blaR1
MNSPTLAILAENMTMTALLIAVVLLLRRPAAALLGPRLAYALWLIPALRLVLPPLPGGELVVSAPPAAMLADVPMEAQTMASVAPMTVDSWLVPMLLLLWLAGAIAVLGLALLRHRRWTRAVMDRAVPLERIGGVALVMSHGVDGPVATGLWRKTIAVPADFFARYNRAERRLAIEHELAHHRAGDLWANAAALMVLAAQWFNPLAWMALRAFRFDQEAACDARVLAGLSTSDRGEQTHSYARAIAKSLAGPRLVLAAPMTSGNQVKERLHMLNQNPRLTPRPLTTRLLLGGAICGALALTMSTLPARVVYASEPAAEAAAKKDEPQVMIFTSERTDSVDLSSDEAGKDGKKPAVSRIIMHRTTDGDGDGKPQVMMFKDGEAAGAMEGLKEFRFAMPMMGVGQDDLRATLKEQGIDDAKADAIIKQLESKRSFPGAHSFRFNTSGDVGAMAMAGTRCKDGEQPRVLVDRSSEGADGKAKVRMVQCGGEISRDKQVAAMKKARERLAAQTGTGMGADIRASVIADLDKSIAELEAKKD